MESMNAEIREEFEKVVNKYGVDLLYMIFNIQGSVDIKLSSNIYYKSQEDMMNELNKIYPVNDVAFEEVIY